MEIVQLAFMAFPILGALAGYALDGLSGATSGFVVPLGPLIMVWLFKGP
jgi:hypothetical protein